MSNAFPLRVPAESLRFLLAGGLATLVNWLIRFPLSLILPFDAAVAAAYVFGMFIGFFLYRQWVFPPTASAFSGQVLRFIAVNILGAGVAIVAAPQLATIVAQSGLSNQMSLALGHAAALALGALVNYFGHKLITFAAPAVLDE
jgi:energy-coupling factor transport system substrate-specific component